MLSLKVALLCVAMSLPFGVAAGWALARGRFRGRALLEALCFVPLVLPPVVTGYLLLLLLGRRGILGPTLESLGLSFAFDWKGAALASAVVGFPLMVWLIRQSIEAVDPRLEAAARSLGAGRLRTFMTVTLPLSLSGVVAGAVLSFARSLGEFGATIMFVANIEGETRTIPLAIYTLLNRPDGDAAAGRLVAVSVLLSLAALTVFFVLVRRRTRC